jgi:regulatory protein
MGDDLSYKAALGKAMALCSRREYCCDDIQMKLDSWGIKGDIAEKVMSTLVKEKFIDEHRYANAFVRDKFKYNKWGKVKIGSNLKIKRVPADIIREALDSLDSDDYRNMLEKLISAQRKKIHAKNQFDLKAKLMRYALSKGFESGLIYEMLEEE